MLEVLCREREPGTEIVGVEQPFDVPLIDLDTGEVLDRALVGTLDLIERDAEGRTVVVDLKRAARKYTDLVGGRVPAALGLQPRDSDERPGRPGRDAAAVRRVDEDEAARALSVLDAAGPGG